MDRVRDAIEYMTDLSFEEALTKATAWAPDLFGLTSWLLSRSGAYRCVISGNVTATGRRAWNREVDDLADRWRAAMDTDDQAVVAGLDQSLDVLREHAELTIAALCSNTAVVDCVLTLHAIADEASAGLGVRLAAPSGRGQRRSYMRAGSLLSQHGTLSTFTTKAMRVLPKIRTAQSGLTLRSLSHHLAIDTSEVDISWHRREYGAETRQLRMLLFPWPFAVRSRDFVPTKHASFDVDERRFGFFDFQPAYASDELDTVFSKTLRAAGSHQAPLDIVVLPECALTSAEFEKLWLVAQEQNVSLLVAGVRGEGKNEAWLRVAQPTGVETFKQCKHHRWFLDEGQIRTYDFGHTLHPKKRWWECIDIGARQLHVLLFTEWLTICHLVCEDLARVDPVSHCLRAIGPNLVIALLLDGPQLGRRWPGRYATVLADDPGSSVLTLTSLGMALRSRPPNTPPSRVIALWKDSELGDKEISLDENATGVVMTVWAQEAEEFTADGRSNRLKTATLVLGGLRQVRPQPT